MSDSIRPIRVGFSLLGAAAVLALGLVASSHSASAVPSAIFTEDFDGITQTNIGTQVNTGLTVGSGDTLNGWSSEGSNAITDVDLIAGSGRDIAVSLYQDAAITMATGVAANTADVSYTVNFDVGATAGNSASDSSIAGDGLVLYVLRADGTVLYSSTQKMGAWNGSTNAQQLSAESFSYVGDGTGLVRLRIASLLYNSPRFGGAIDNIQIESSPTTCVPTSSTNGGNTILKFTTVGTCNWVVPSGVSSVQTLVVGGGGGGSSDVGGGGGGGQVVSSTLNVSGTVAIKVGAGGVFGWKRMYNDTAGGKTGGRSAIGSLTSALGGSGANGRFSNNLNPDGSANNTGFTGGGGPYEDCGGCNAGNTGSGGASFKGGDGSGNGGGGGGGASAAGADRADGAAGGIGIASTITGSSLHYGGGGGGGAYPDNITPGPGGLGGGGDGVGNYNTRGESGLDGRGGGGGGAASDGGEWGHGGMGGSGVVIIKYGTPVTTTSTTTTSTTTTSTTTTSTTVPAAVVIDIRVPSGSATTVPQGQASVATIAPGAKTVVTNPMSTTTIPSAASQLGAPSGNETAPVIPKVSTGEGALDVGGVSTKVDVVRENNQIVIKTGSLQAVMSGVDDAGATRALDSDGNLRLASGDVVRINVGGFKPGSDVDVWLFSTPTHMGTSVVGADGQVSGSFTVPEGIEDGSHRIAVTAKLPNGKSATFTLGIAVGEIAKTSSLTRILIAIPISLAVLAGFVLPNQLRRRRRKIA